MTLKKYRILKSFNSENYKKNLRKTILYLYQRAYQAYIVD